MTQDSAITTVTTTAVALLEREYFGNSVRAWLTALAVASAVLGTLLILRHLLVGRLTRLAERTHTRVDDYVVGLLRRTRYFFIVTIAIAAALPFLLLPEELRGLLYRLARLAVIVQGGMWANELVTQYLHRLVREKASTDLASVTTINALAMVTRLVLWVVVFLVALANFGIDITALITGLGIAGIAVALAVQNVLGDLLASLSIVLDKPFVVGDFITIDTFSGTVEEIGLKTTRLRSVSGEQLIISNADLLKARVRNFKRMTERRVVLQFGVEYGTPKATLARIPDDVRAIVTGTALTRFDRAHFFRFGPSSLDFEVVYFVLSPEYAAFMDAQQQINLAIYEHVQALGAAFAFPTQTLVVRQEAGETFLTHPDGRPVDGQAADGQPDAAAPAAAG